MNNPVKNIIKGRAMGHPVHIMLVHFPIAFLPMSAVLDLLSIIYSDYTLSLFSFYASSAGVLLGMLAMLFGIIDLLFISPEEKFFNTALLHGGLNFLWISVFAVITGSKIKNLPAINVPDNIQVIIEFVSVIGMFYSNYLGGELVLKHGIGKK